MKYESHCDPEIGKFQESNILIAVYALDLVV